MNQILQLTNILREFMFMGAFVIFLVAWFFHHKDKSDFISTAKYLVFLLTLFTLIFYAKDIILTGRDLIDEEANLVSSKISVFMDNLGKIDVEGQDSTFSIMGPMIGTALDILHVITETLSKILKYFQTSLLYIMYGVSPLLISFIAFPPTRSLGSKYITTTFSIMMWSFGIVMADLIFLSAYESIINDISLSASEGALASMAGTSIANVACSMEAAAWLISMLVLLLFLYVFSPILITSVLSGGSPGQAVGSAIGAVGALAGSVAGGAGAVAAAGKAGAAAGKAAAAGGGGGGEGGGGGGSGGGGSGGGGSGGGMARKAMGMAKKGVGMMGLAAKDVSARRN